MAGMPAKIAAMAVLAVLAFAAAKPKAPAVSRGENETVRLTATLYADKDAVKQLLGDELGGHYLVVAVRVEPKYGKEVNVLRDDFVMRSDRDGERTGPLAPSQIAGRGALVVTQSGARSVRGDSGGPSWGGIPGTGGRPRQLPGSGGSFGSGGMGDAGQSRAKVESGAQEKDNPLLQVLKDKALPEKKTSEAVSGLLYFPLEKQKPKDLELSYPTAEGKLLLRWK